MEVLLKQVVKVNMLSVLGSFTYMNDVIMSNTILLITK